MYILVESVPSTKESNQYLNGLTLLPLPEFVFFLWKSEKRPNMWTVGIEMIAFVLLIGNTSQYFDIVTQFLSLFFLTKVVFYQGKEGRRQVLVAVKRKPSQMLELANFTSLPRTSLVLHLQIGPVTICWYHIICFPLANLRLAFLGKMFCFLGLNYIIIYNCI